MVTMFRAREGAIRVIYLDAVGGHGGMKELDLALCSAIARCGLSVVYATCDETSGRNSEVEVWTPLKEIYGQKPRWIRAVNYWRGLLAVLQRAQSCRGDGKTVVHIQIFNPIVLDLLFVWLAKRSGLKTVATVHDVLPFGFKRSTISFLRVLYRSLDGLVVHNSFACSEMRHLIGGTSQPVYVIPHGHLNLDLGEGVVPSQEEARQALGLPIDVPVVLFFGQVRREKGLEYLVRAMQTVIATNPSAMLVIAGKAQAQDRREFEDLIIRLNLSANIRADWGFVTDSQVSWYFRASDVVALPYVRVYQSGVCYRAYSFCRPVVASSVGGIPDQVLDGATGYLVPPADQQALAEALTKILRNRGLADAMGSRGHDWVAESLDWDELAGQTVQVYEAVLKQRPNIASTLQCASMEGRTDD